ncbi:MAG: NAD-dependent epimerase/dehydratase family protein [Myxococcales bacterium]|nr:NAD-dependent epimerase/dehydratase family protein [Myxococcales bacterium]MCB9531735.1 NAD-dependent epimerase/dehydratase family protein [Myxococcales bacterium]MCB9534098.1 NAD-dependent epimerase/dehydratase family protein [Myxococcales bacterium]
MTGPRLVLGLGYCGRRAAVAWRDAGAEVAATVRSTAAAASAPTGVRVLVADFDVEVPSDAVWERPTLAQGTACGVLTFGTGAAARGEVDAADRPDRVARREGGPGSAAITRAVALSAASGVTRLVYLSSTSVYGDRGGGWVDADTPVAPDTQMGARRVEAERAFREACLQSGVPGMVLRLPGIVGPGRTPAPRFLAGTYAYPRDAAHRIGNRIHVDDIVSAVDRLHAAGARDETYLAADGAPFEAAEMIEYVATRVGVAVPAGVGIDELSPASRPFWAGSRRCGTDKLRALGWEPRYVNFRDALEASWREERDLGGSAVSPQPEP